MIKYLQTLFLLFLFGCQKKVEDQPKSYPVKIETVIQRDTPFFVKGVGSLGASVKVDMMAQVSGTLTSVLFDDGQMVEEGDLLMTIDPRIYEANVKEAEATLAEDKARLKYALDFAETYGSLVGQSYVARLDYSQGVQNVDVYKAAVEADLAELKKAKINLDYTELRAPFKGYVGLRKFDPGNYVDEMSDEPLVSVRKVTPLTVSFSLPAKYLQEIREKQKIEPLFLEAVLPNDLSHPLQGTLIFIDNEVNDETGMIHLKGTIPNVDERGWPGEFVRVFLRLRIIKDAVLVPTNAIVLGEIGHFVFVLDENTMTVSMRMIGIEKHEIENYTIVTWGLKGGEKVVSDGQLNLHGGTKVHIPIPKEKTT